MAGRQGKGKRPSQAIEEIRTKLDAQLQQLATRLDAGEKAVKTSSLNFSNRIFGGAQEAFEKCEALNQETDELRDKSEAEHAAKRAALGAKRLKLEKSLGDTAAAMSDLRSVQEEAAQVVARLRERVIHVPAGKPGRSHQKQLSSALRPAGSGAGPATSKQRRTAPGGKTRMAPGQGGKQGKGAGEEAGEHREGRQDRNVTFGQSK